MSLKIDVEDTDLSEVVAKLLLRDGFVKKTTTSFLSRCGRVIDVFDAVCQERGHAVHQKW